MSEENAKLTLDLVNSNPELVTNVVTLKSGERVVFRPLEKEDEQALASFLEVLSLQTSEFSIFSGYDLAAARELCDAINRYDKLRMVATSEVTQKIIAIFELGFGMPQTDIERYVRYGYELEDDKDCRFGPTIADEYQNQGLGSLLLPYLVEIVRRFGSKSIILWGGVFTDNQRAIRYYEKNGFKLMGTYKNIDDKECADMMLEL